MTEPLMRDSQLLKTSSNKALALLREFEIVHHTPGAHPTTEMQEIEKIETALHELEDTIYLIRNSINERRLVALTQRKEGK